MPPGRADRKTPRKTTTGSCCAARARCRPASNGSASPDARTRASPAGSPRARSRRALCPRAPSRWARSRRTASLVTAACPVTACPVLASPLVACPTARRRAHLLTGACRTAGTQMAACPMGRSPTAARRTRAYRTVRLRTVRLRTVPLRTVPLSTVPLRTVPLSTVPLRTVECRMAACRAAGSRTLVPHLMALPCPMAGQYPAHSIGCRTGAGCRRAQTGSTGRRGPAHRAGPRVGTMGRVRPPKTHTPTVGAARSRRRAHRRRAAPGPQDRPQARLTEVRSPTVPPGHRGYLGHPGYPGHLGYPGLRRCASTRPPGRASVLLTAASGWGHRWARHRGHHLGHRWALGRSHRGR
jgi:hypothetical protein